MLRRKSLVLAVLSIAVFAFAFSLTVTQGAHAGWTTRSCCAEPFPDHPECSWTFGHWEKIDLQWVCKCIPPADTLDPNYTCFHGCPPCAADPGLD